MEQELTWHKRDVRIFTPLSGHNEGRGPMRVVVINKAERECQNNLDNCQKRA